MTTNTTEKATRITKDNRFEDIAALLQGQTAPHGTDVQTALEFIKRERELLSRKNNADNKKPTKTQIENVGLMEDIVKYLSEIPADTMEGRTCTDMFKAMPQFVSPNKVASLCGKLRKEGRVTSKEHKNRVVFFIA